MSSFQAVLRKLGMLAGILVAIFLLFWLILGAAVFAGYFYFFRVLVSYGGMNAWVARVVSILFAAALYFGLRFLFSFKKNRRTKGWCLLIGSFLVLNLLVYFCRPPATGVVDGENFFTTTGEPRVSYYISKDGEWELFPGRGGYHPRTGEPLKPMTPSAARQYEAYKRAKAADAERQRAKENAEQQAARRQRENQQRKAQARAFREKYLNDLGESPRDELSETVALAIKGDGATAQEEFFRGEITRLIQNQGRKPLSGLFKPAFYTDGLFDQVWDGDTAVLERLGLPDRAPAHYLLARVAFTEATQTQFDRLVSVQGELSLLLVGEDATGAPCVFTASGAGSDADAAAMNCAKRLVQSVKVDAIFPK